MFGLHRVQHTDEELRLMLSIETQLDKDDDWIIPLAYCRLPRERPFTCIGPLVLVRKVAIHEDGSPKAWRHDGRVRMTYSVRIHPMTRQTTPST